MNREPLREITDEEIRTFRDIAFHPPAAGRTGR